MTWSALAAGALFATASFGLGWVVTRLGVAIASRRLRRSADAPWIERARRAYPARQTVLLDVIAMPVALGACALLGKVPGLGPGRAAAAWAALGGLAGLLGVMFVGRRLERRLCRRGDGSAPAGIPSPGCSSRPSSCRFC